MSWSGVKKYTNNVEIESWCDEMHISNYTINSQGEIDVNGEVDLKYSDFEELPYKFGKVKGYFSVMMCLNLTSLKNCPDYVGNYFDVDDCPQLDSLEGCPKEVNDSFFCNRCKCEFTEEEVKSLCKVKGDIFGVKM